MVIINYLTIFNCQTGDTWWIVCPLYIVICDDKPKYDAIRWTKYDRLALLFKLHPPLGIIWHLRQVAVDVNHTAEPTHRETPAVTRSGSPASWVTSWVLVHQNHGDRLVSVLHAPSGTTVSDGGQSTIHGGSQSARRLPEAWQTQTVSDDWYIWCSGWEWWHTMIR